MQRCGARLDDSVMVGPGGLETVGEFFYWLTRLRSQTRKPTSAAAKPLTIQTRFFMPAPLLRMSTIPWERREELDAGDGDGVYVGRER